MIRKLLYTLLIIIILFTAYILFWPVSIKPVAWKAPPNPGYTGAFAQNTRLQGLQTFPLGGLHGPEDVALDKQGRIYASTHEGYIVRLQPDGSKPEKWAHTEGRPLGIDFDFQGNLIVADAYRGLLSISSDGKVTMLADKADGLPILYADDVDVAADGKIYFSDASTRFSAKAIGDTMEASLYELIEHQASGRLLVYDPKIKKASTVHAGFAFANGVAVSQDQQYVLVNDTAAYRVVQVWIAGPKKGQTNDFITALPSFPDNISTGLDGRYWVALVSPRNTLVDQLDNKPFVRKMLQRLPKFMRPKATPYGHIICLDQNGKVTLDLQDPAGAYPLNTSVIETTDYLYIGSLVTPVLARLSKSKIGIK